MTDVRYLLTNVVDNLLTPPPCLFSQPDGVQGLELFYDEKTNAILESLQEALVSPYLSCLRD